MINPIYLKIEKLFNHKCDPKREYLQDSINKSLYDTNNNSKSQHPIANNHNKSQAKDNKWKCLKKIIRQFKNKNKELKGKVKQHQKMEEFYIEQLNRRRRIQKQLQWKLKIINQQIIRTQKPRLTISYSEQQLNKTLSPPLLKQQNSLRAL